MYDNEFNEEDDNSFKSQGIFTASLFRNYKIKTRLEVNVENGGLKNDMN